MFQKNSPSYGDPIHLEARNLRFTVFTSEEVKKLSVLKISTPLSFTSLGYPCRGGIYDPLLGPSGLGAICSTCRNVIANCPGHFGHIELPLPVVNPFFHKAVCTILKFTCLTCFHLQFPVQVKLQLLAKFQLLQEGYFNELADLQQEIEMEEKNIGNSAAEAKIEYLQEIIKRHIETLRNKDRFSSRRKDEASTNTRSLNLQWQYFIEDYLKNKISSTQPKICMYCSGIMLPMKIIKNRILISTAKRTEALSMKRENQMVMPNEAKNYIRQVWSNESEVLKIMFPCLNMVDSENPTDVFFFDVVPVLPPTVRPAAFVHNEMVENPQSQAYKAIVHDCMIINNIVKSIKDGDTAQLSEDARFIVEAVRGGNMIEKLHASWQKLQVDVDHLMDRELNKTTESATINGLKQIIEKKEGIIRMHMMGKRVNFSARSVITPDPNLNVDEIGIPEAFALKLTYPVPVTAHNVTKLRAMVMNGPNIHPGAVMLEDEDGRITRLSAVDAVKREAIAKSLLTTSKANKSFSGVKIVYRHLVNGDILLLNRQPTLHRPSIMAHKARILKGEKTLRLHYANCKHYNCDFDGDEMNAHFIQNELGRSEAYSIANVPNQYLSPKDGSPLSGLIQDHIIGGVKMAMRGKFFNKTDYMNLVWSALNIIPGEIKTLPPSILKPVVRWSGKQVISTVIINVISRGKSLINLTQKSKIDVKQWQTEPERPTKYGGTPLTGIQMTEAEVVIRQGELLSGILDKAHYGTSPRGLVHCVHELYGSEYSSKLLSAFGKLFQSFLQKHGFSLGIQDILVKKKDDQKRKKIIRELRKVGPDLHRSILGLDETATNEEVRRKMHENYTSDPKFRAVVDRKYKDALKDFTNTMHKTCIPGGLLLKFPHNNLQLMILSGAKGSMVNGYQISSLLDQIELEGKRPPLMISGKSLPCFEPYDSSPMAGGFVERRFLTGIKPQEFFFHCMAGREGLIDTAVKTSRTGYLQRCLIKNLEGLVVHYDMTVRDSDGSLIQTAYGEDGLDICSSRFICKQQLEFLVENRNAIVDKKLVDKLKEDSEQHLINKRNREINKWKKRHGHPMQKGHVSGFSRFCQDNPIKDKPKYKKIQPNGRTEGHMSMMRKWVRANQEVKDKYMEEAERCPDPVTAHHRPDIEFGVLPETVESLIAEYQKTNHPPTATISKAELKDLLCAKIQKAICPPGEPVGILAAQSIGEPSTQMTLNTFHFAGRGAQNVTLGIPRLREILMMASKNPKTPFMEIPFKSDLPNQKRAVEKLCQKLNRCTLADVLDNSSGGWRFSLTPYPRNEYTLNFKFKPHKCYKTTFHTNPKKVLHCMETVFFDKLFKAICRIGRNTSATKLVDFEKDSKAKPSGAMDAELDFVGDENEEIPVHEKSKLELGEQLSSDEEDMGEDADATDARRAERQQENEDYDEPEEEEEMDDPDKEINEEEENVEKSNGNATEDEEENVDYRKNDEGMEEDRIEYVKAASHMVIGYEYDHENSLWCKVQFWLPFLMNEMRLEQIVRLVAQSVTLWEVPGIKRAFTTTNNDNIILNTEGINIGEVAKYHDTLDISRFYSNDVYAISQTYGIEAANRVIIKEIQNTFKPYDIFVDFRHLSLIADLMTSDGTYKPMNRKGMENNASPLLQMSFECPQSFLKNATLQAKQDDLNTPSSRIMLGLPIKCGTGMFSTLTDMKKYMK